MGTRRKARASTETLSVDGWADHFRGIDVSKGMRVSVAPDGGEAVHREVGGAHRLHGIEYDAEADAIAIDVGEHDADSPYLRYFVVGPRSIVIEKLAEATTIVIVDERGERTHVYVYPESVTLPPASTDRETSDHAEGRN